MFIPLLHKHEGPQMGDVLSTHCKIREDRLG